VRVADVGKGVLAARNRIGACRQHGVDRIPASAQARLRPLIVERNAQREHLAGLDQGRGLDDVLGPYVVERADLVVLAPTAPVLELVRRFGDRLLSDRYVHGVPPMNRRAESASRSLRRADIGAAGRKRKAWGAGSRFVTLTLWLVRCVGWVERSETHC